MKQIVGCPDFGLDRFIISWLASRSLCRDSNMKV